jgi:TolA-binding protein
LRALKTTIVCLCAGAVVGCGYYGREDGERLANEVHALQTQASAMQQALSELQEERKRLADTLSKVDREVSQLNAAARRNDADLGVQLDEAMQTVARLKGLVEGSQERLSALESSVNKVQEELDLRFQNLQEQARVDSMKSQAEKEKAIADAKKNERLLAEPTQLFPEIERMIKDGKPGDARKLLRELTIRAKGDKSLQKHLAEALYLIGETYFAEGNYQQAAAEYNGVRKAHPKSDRVPDALYRLGMCFEKLNLPDDAKLFYKTVIQSHGKTKVAKDAKARLDALK